jgi:uncharacterized protein (TIRG00374 family)
MAQNKHKKNKWKTGLSAITILALAGLVYALRHQMYDTFQNLQHVNLWAIILMPLLQMVNYHSYAKMYKDVYGLLDDDLTYKSLFKVQLELNFVNHILPSGGVSGISYFSLRMRSLGVGAGKSTLVQLIKFGLLFISFQAVLALGLLALAIGGKANSFLILIAGSLSTLLFVGTFLAAYMLGSRQRINSFFIFLTKALNKVISIFRRGHHETIKIDRVRATFDELHDNYLLIRRNVKKLKWPLIWSLVANVTEILTVYVVYIAFGKFVNIGAVTIAYAVSNFAGLISVLPGGIGIYEALMTGTLVAAGVPAALSLPVTVMYRILSTIIQLPPGYYYYHKFIHSNDSGK